ncbi:hypothetical protein [Chromatocurvus halotolerans]|uniref:Uncharacterized protein n=1 Tax=Chromatocurvus halotolerans TaxID=1132028 RepID=A0A4V2SB98_9GAMM|nr:hypothetical protein [Chromatocurvus halotolerans]TCO74660.1 hypothetical protein EV688_11219 [Chromatocurvus halotolerans]
MRGTTGTFGSVKIASAILLSALLVTVMALAQPAEDRDRPDATAPPTETATASAEPQSSDDTAASEEGIVLSPFDYEASESISEDASVSFPVDI